MKQTYFPGLNTLRLYAAISVLTSHAVGHVAGNIRFAINLIFLDGPNAVTLFFVLSGFLITYLLLQERQKTGYISVKGFYIRRASRILPLYYLIIFFSALVFPVADPAGYIPVLLLSPHTVLPFIAEAGIGQLWSIGVEEWFYLIWPVLVKRFSLLKVIAAVIVMRLSLVLIWPALLLAASKYPDQYGYGFMFLRYIHVESMAIGALGAWLVFYHHPILKLIYKAELLIWLVSLMIVILPVDGGMLDDLAISCMFMLLIVVVGTKPRPRINIENKALSWLGQMTYGVYMYHGLVLVLLARYSPLSDWAYVIAGIILTLVTAMISYYLFERPFMGVRRRFEKSPLLVPASTT